MLGFSARVKREPPSWAGMDDDLRSTQEPTLHPPWMYRGKDLSRVLALSDGVFAFAMTLLVLELALPAGVHGGAIRSYLTSSTFVTDLYAYLISFFIISLWWQAHHLVFGYLRSYDRNLVRINSVFLLSVAIVPFATTVLNSSGSDPVGVAVFAAIQVVAGVALSGLWWYGLRRAGLTAPQLPAEWQQYVTTMTLLTPVLFAVSVPVAWLNVTLAEILWLGVFVGPVVARQRARRRRATTNAPGTP